MNNPYSNMSDTEINVKVAKALGLTFEEHDGVVYAADKHEGSNVLNVQMPYDPCNNPADAWPIIQGIWDYLMHCEAWDFPQDADADTRWDQCIGADRNALKGAMVAFLGGL